MPREGHDRRADALALAAVAFQSTCPARGTTFSAYPQSPWESISIHVPREGHDHLGLPREASHTISIHVPREGHDAQPPPPVSVWRRFQSTCPARGTTKIWYGFFYGFRDFNPRAPRGARRGSGRQSTAAIGYFNPRAPRGARRHIRLVSACAGLFQSTCPARGTTRRGLALGIHTVDFNPRAPRGARLPRPQSSVGSAVFQSTCPARGTTHGSVLKNHGADISIHVPREGHDLRQERGRGHRSGISIHVPREGHDW